MPARRRTIRNRVIDADLGLQLRLFGNRKHENKDGIIVTVLFFSHRKIQILGYFLVETVSESVRQNVSMAAAIPSKFVSASVEASFNQLKS